MIVTLAALRARVVRLVRALEALQKEGRDRKAIAAHEAAIEELQAAIGERMRELAPKRKRLFRPDPGPRTTSAVVDVDVFGDVRRIEAAGAEAASHWDVRLWHRLH